MSLGAGSGDSDAGRGGGGAGRGGGGGVAGEGGGGSGRRLMRLGKRRGAGVAHPTHARRRVFIDLGAAWGDTLDLHVDLVANSSVDRTARNWEVYAVEADPQVGDYAGQLAAWKNGQGPEPPTPCEPPVGSSHDRARFAHVVGCHRKWKSKMNSCLNRLLGGVRQSLGWDAQRLTPASVRARLDEALTPYTPDDTQA